MLGLLLFLGSGCASNPPVFTPAATSPPSLERDQIIIIGDIDAYEPLKKVKRFGPLAGYLAENLSEFGIRKGEVIIARDIPEMGRYLKEGEIDFFFDSGFQVLR